MTVPGQPGPHPSGSNSPARSPASALVCARLRASVSPGAGLTGRTAASARCPGLATRRCRVLIRRPCDLGHHCSWAQWGCRGPTAPGGIVPPGIAHGTGGSSHGGWDLSENGVRDLVPEDTSSWLLGALGALAARAPAPGRESGKAGGGRRPPTCRPCSRNAASPRHFPFIQHLAWYHCTARNIVQEPTVGPRELGLLSCVLQGHGSPVGDGLSPVRLAAWPGRGEAGSPPLQRVLSRGPRAFEDWSARGPAQTAGAGGAAGGGLPAAPPGGRLLCCSGRRSGAGPPPAQPGARPRR